MSNKEKTLELKPVHPDEVDKVLQNLSNTKAVGVDNIDMYILYTFDWQPVWEFFKSIVSICCQF